MKIEQAKKAIENCVCDGCEYLKDDKSGFECMSEEAHDCEGHKIEAAKTIIAALEAELAESKVSQQRLRLMADSQDGIIEAIQAERDELLECGRRRLNEN